MTHWRPIEFTPEMKLAVIEGRKTQTRRVVKPQPLDIFTETTDINNEPLDSARFYPMEISQHGHGWDIGYSNELKCPYGVPGDGLYFFSPTPTSSMERIGLELTDVRVQRVQDITEKDAKAEGVEPYRPAPGLPSSHYVSFAKLWDSIYADQPEKQWDKNLWVWALTFRRI